MWLLIIVAPTADMATFTATIPDAVYSPTHAQKAFNLDVAKFNDAIGQACNFVISHGKSYLGVHKLAITDDRIECTYAPLCQLAADCVVHLDVAAWGARDHAINPIFVFL